MQVKAMAQNNFVSHFPFWRRVANFIKNSIVMAFTTLERGTFASQIGTSLLLSVVTSPIAWFVTKIKMHVLQDSSFVEVLTIALVLDLVLGVWKHLKANTFCWRRLYTGFLEKVGVSFIGMVLFNLTVDIKEWQHVESVKDYIILVGKLLNLFYVAGSAFNSLYVITGGKFPPIGWMNKMKNFNTSLDPNALKDEKPTT